MAGRPNHAKAKAQSDAIVTKAVLRAALALHISGADLAKILGVSGTTISRLPERKLKLDKKEAELALLFLRIFRSLDALMGGDEHAAKAWFHSPNRHLNGVPAELIESPSGLVHVADYLDAFRGKI